MEEIKLTEYFIKYLDIIGIVSAFIFVIIPIITTWRNNKEKDLMRASFDQTIKGILTENQSSKISSAILLRRFLNKHSKEGKDKDTYKSETINVITSLLKSEKCSDYQKTLADSLSYTLNLDRCDLQSCNLQNMCLKPNYDALVDDLTFFVRTYKRFCHWRVKRHYIICDALGIDIESTTQDINTKIKDKIPTKHKKSIYRSWLRFENFIFGWLDKLCEDRDSITISMNYTDLFQTDLSYATINNINARGAIFYKSNLYKATFRNCNLADANFHGAYIHGARFIDCNIDDKILNNAIGQATIKEGKNTERTIPKETENIKHSKKIFISCLGNLTYEQSMLLDRIENIIGKYNVTNRRIATEVEQAKKAEIESNATCSTILSSERAKDIEKRIREEIEAEITAERSVELKSQEYEQLRSVRFAKNKYRKIGQISSIITEISECEGVIVLAFVDTHIINGNYKENTSDHKTLSNKIITSPWIHTEIGIAAALGKNILLLHDDGIEEGVFENSIQDTTFTQIEHHSINHADLKDTINAWLTRI